MQTIVFLMKGILIGLLFGIPIGAVGTTTVQRTIANGWRAGLITGLGSSVADVIYACIGAFGLTFISDLLLKYQRGIVLVGGTFVIFMGISAWQKPFHKITENKNTKINWLQMFGTSFLIGITNPAAILTFLFAFTYFGINQISSVINGIAIVVGVFFGTFIWWSILSFGTDVVAKKSSIKKFSKLNSVFGTILIIFGVVVLSRGILG